jgi:hypothetical protein
MITMTYCQIGRRSFRIIRTDDAIYITTNNIHGSAKDIPVDSELGKKILAKATR